jgi:hypothetical protein
MLRSHYPGGRIRTRLPLSAGPDLQPVRVAVDIHRDIGFEAMDGNVPDRPDLSREENELLLSWQTE